MASALPSTVASDAAVASPLWISVTASDATAEAVTTLAAMAPTLASMRPLTSAAGSRLWKSLVSATTSPAVCAVPPICVVSTCSRSPPPISESYTLAASTQHSRRTASAPATCTKITSGPSVLVSVASSVA